jgi:sensor histidine kinase YesM
MGWPKRASPPRRIAAKSACPASTGEASVGSGRAHRRGAVTVVRLRRFVVSLPAGRNGVETIDCCRIATEHRPRMRAESVPVLPSASRRGYWRRVGGALDRGRISIVAVVTLIVSLRILMQPDLFDFFTPLEILMAWAQHYLELGAIAGVLLLVYTLLDETLDQHAPLRLPVLLGSLLAAAVVLTAAAASWFIGGLPPALSLASGALRIALPALFLALLVEVYRRADRTDLALREAEAAQDRLGREETEQALYQLQAQLEPHFLFNTLANVRRLYRTDPRSGARATASLMLYLKAAMPQLRRETASLGAELELVRAYLDLFRVRMGRRLTYAIDAAPGVLGAEFPPMLLLTLVENAVKHGLEPSRGGGHVAVTAAARGGTLEVGVTDNGVGFDVAGSAGTGVGLANIRRQLQARYGAAAALTLAAAQPQGAAATIVVPLRMAAAPSAPVLALP